MRVIKQMNAEVELDCEFSKPLNQENMPEQMNTHILITSVSHLTVEKTNNELDGERSVKAKREREKKRTIWDVPRDKNARHQTKHERQNKGDKMLLMCVEGARGPLLYQNSEAKQGGKNSYLQIRPPLFFKFPLKLSRSN